MANELVQVVMDSSTKLIFNERLEMISTLLSTLKEQSVSLESPNENVTGPTDNVVIPPDFLEIQIGNNTEANDDSLMDTATPADDCGSCCIFEKESRRAPSGPQLVVDPSSDVPKIVESDKNMQVDRLLKGNENESENDDPFKVAYTFFILKSRHIILFFTVKKMGTYGAFHLSSLTHGPDPF